MEKNRITALLTCAGISILASELGEARASELHFEEEPTEKTSFHRISPLFEEISTEDQTEIDNSNSSCSNGVCW